MKNSKKIINIIKNNSYFKCKELPNMNLINFMVKSKNWNIDTIKANNTIIPIDIVPFEKHHKIIDKKKVVLHFYMFDNSFKQVINNPNKYVSILKQFGGIISFDLSLYIDMPLSLQMVNKFKNHKVAAYLQKLGINVIPNVRWGDERSFSFCFEGFEKRGIYAVSTHGCIKTKIEKTMFVNGLRKMIEVLEPKVILVHGPMPKEVFDQFKRKVVFVNYSSWISRCNNNNNNNKENKYENKYEKIQANN